MDCIAAFESVGTYRGAAAMCGVDAKTVKRKVLAHEAGVLDDERAERAPVPKNTDGVRMVVLDLVREANGRGTAKRLLPAARAACYAGSRRAQFVGRLPYIAIVRSTLSRAVRVSSSLSGQRWLYVSRVSVADWWPSRFCTVLIEQFREISRDA